ncbi:hypothetical protein [Thalassobacillus hwangdonensis]|uniref:Polyketide cyclase n=1 Tax=Thalassobacillus hwangdonensis TaxID=546108 RepID=A0ABW3L8D4_9BACI
MKSNQYEMRKTWKVKGNRDELFEILTNAVDYPRWWPSLFLDIEDTGVVKEAGGNMYALRSTGGWFPATLQWNLVNVNESTPYRVSVRACGDVTGRGTWKLTEDGEYVNVELLWILEADKPLLKYLSFILKPVFMANFHWCMKRGYESLNLELQRRRATSHEEIRQLPSPPGPTFQPKEKVKSS